jgi:threonine/homoserine/homoserine lactone efflux protein
VFLDTNLILFITASAALTVAPGPDNLYIVTRGVAQGRKAALVSACGMGVGVGIHTVFAAVGLSALLAQSATAFLIIKYAGAAYLIYLGIRTLLGKDGFDIPEEATPMGTKSVFFQAVVSDVLNPKVALFFLSFLPQFVNPEAGSVALQLLALGAIFAIIGLVIDGVIAFFSGSLGDWLKNKMGFAGALRWLMGGVLVALGLRLVFSDRR